MRQKKLGDTGIPISAIGFGAFQLSHSSRPPDEIAVALIQRALDLGITMIDTADSYCVNERDKHHNEKLIIRALASYDRDVSQLIVATKGGIMRPRGNWVRNGDPKYLQKTILESCRLFGEERPIPLWQFHAVDPHFPIEVSLAAVRRAVDRGFIRFVGLSNTTVKQIRRARAVVDIVSVQNQFNPWHREPEWDGVLEYCEREKITFFPWSPLGGRNGVLHLHKIPTIRLIARDREISPQRLVLAWLMAKSSCIVPIPGASSIGTLEDSVRSVDVSLHKEEIRRIDKATSHI